MPSLVAIPAPVFEGKQSGSAEERYWEGDWEELREGNCDRDVMYERRIN